MVVALWYTASFTAAKRSKSLRYCGVFEGESKFNLEVVLCNSGICSNQNSYIKVVELFVFSVTSGIFILYMSYT